MFGEMIPLAKGHMCLQHAKVQQGRKFLVHLELAFEFLFLLPVPCQMKLKNDRYDFEPEDAVFIDDSGANIATAMSLGFDALLFEHSGRLREQLVERSLL